MLRQRGGVRDHLDDGGRLGTTDAARDACDAWFRLLAGVQDAVRDFAVKLDSAADAYERHDSAAGDAFAPLGAGSCVIPGWPKP